jgi:sec-independent protein translocase protein TatC
MFNHNISILKHVKELKYRSAYIFLSTILNFALSYYYSLELLYFFAKPLINLKIDHFKYSLIYTNITEAFFTYLNISLYISSIFSFFFLIHQIIYFVIPGLYFKESLFLIQFKRNIYLFCIISILITYFFFIPIMWNFFLSNDNSNTISSMSIHFEGKLDEYIFLLFKVFFSIFCIFISPLLLFILIKFKILYLRTLINKRNISFILIFFFCALISPPDIISQILLSLPLCISYEVIILITLYDNIKKLL